MMNSKIQIGVWERVNDFGGSESFEAHYVAETKEEAEAVAAKFPKFVKVKLETIGFWKNDVSISRPVVQFTVRFGGDKVNGGVNETGAKRLAKFRELTGL